MSASGEKKMDKRKALRDLSEKLGAAYLAELLAEKRHQDARAVLHGARTPTAGDHANIAATRKAMLTKARERLVVMTEMDALLGIERDKKTPPGQALDAVPDPHPAD